MGINVDAPPADDAQQAEFLMLHHLRLAAMYFEATDENLCPRLPTDDFSRPAMAAWVEAMEALYPDNDAPLDGPPPMSDEEARFHMRAGTIAPPADGVFPPCPNCGSKSLRCGCD